MQRGIRREYIEATYELLVEGGFENASIRKIAAKMHCNSATLYRHFPDVRYLIAIASMRFLRPYYEAFSALTSHNPSPLESAIQAWECFAFYAFQNIPIFNNLFFGEGVSTYDAAREYAKEFPEEVMELPPFVTPYWEMSDLRERDVFSLRRIAEMGAISPDSVEYLADIDILTLRGLFAQYGKQALDKKSAAPIIATYMNIVYHAYAQELRPGFRILSSSPKERMNFKR